MCVNEIPYIVIIFFIFNELLIRLDHIFEPFSGGSLQESEKGGFCEFTSKVTNRKGTKKVIEDKSSKF